MEDIEIEAVEPDTPEIAEAPAKRGRKAKAPKPDEIEAVEPDTPVRRLPVKLIRNYHPADKGFTIGGRKPTAEELEKVPAGSEIELEISEAQAVCQKGIAVRNDPFA